MKILITNTYYFPAFDGGAEISVKLLAEGILAAGHQVYVLTTGAVTKVYRVNGVIVISLKQKNIFNSYNKGKVPLFLKMVWHIIDSCNFFYYFKISAILKKIKPHIVHTNNIQGFSPFLWLTVKSQNIPLVHSMRDYYMLCFKCNMFNSEQKNCEQLCTACKVTHAIKRKFLNYPDFFIAISHHILNKYQRYVPIPDKRSSVIYNAVASDVRPKPRVMTDKLRFGFIGRVAKDKGVEFLVNELAGLNGMQKAAFTITFAGKGEDGFIQKLKQKLTGIEYEFLGVATPAEFYNSIDVLLVPALWDEPFGRIVIESLSYGVPVCQSDRGGLNELYDPASSWLFKPEAGELSALIVYILNNKDQVAQKKLQCAGQIDRFSAKHYISKHIDLYTTIATNNKPEYSKAGGAPALLIKTD